MMGWACSPENLAWEVERKLQIFHFAITREVSKRFRPVSYCRMQPQLLLSSSLFVGRYWRMVDRLKVTHFYTVPSVLKQLRKEDEKFVSKCDLNSLKIIAVGVYL